MKGAFICIYKLCHIHISLQSQIKSSSDYFDKVLIAGNRDGFMDTKTALKVC